MTIIEFFDNTSIENIVSALLCNPDKVILVGDNGKRMKKYIDIYNEVLSNRNINVELRYKTVNKNNLSNIIRILTEIVEENENCIFDLEGGEDLTLVAVGYIANMYKDKVMLHRFNIRNGSLIDCDSDGEVLQTAPMEISVEENIRIYAGKIITDFTTGYEWDFNEDFVSDLEVMWEICRENSTRWNKLGFTLTQCGKACFEEETVIINEETAGISWRRKTEELDFALLKRLKSIGLINNYIANDDLIKFQFKNEQIRRCIVKAGQLLELYITLVAKSAKDKYNKPIYNDVQTGVLLNWDGFVDTPETPEMIRTTNEIDLILMKGLVPVFISCKNGMVDVDELYKLSSVAERFGGKYAKKVLIVSDLDASNSNYKYITSRAEDMNIRLIDDVADLNAKDLERAIASLWSN